MEATQSTSVNEWMNKVHADGRLLPNYKTEWNCIMFQGMDEPKNSVISEISHIQKDKNCVVSLM